MNDVLSDVLRFSPLGSALLNQSELVPPFGLDVGPEVRAAVHVVQRGMCWLRVPRKKVLLPLGAGDVVLLPHGTRHILADSPRTRAVPFGDALAEMPARLAKLDGSRRTSTTTLVCAEIRFDLGGPHALMSALPEIVHLPADAGAGDGDLQAVAKLLLREAGSSRVGSELLVPRLIDALLIFVVRSWIEHQPLGDGGWLGALRDPQMGRALALIHEKPAAPWTVGSLAAEVGMSRAPFARRFRLLVGEPPLGYVTRWRMNIAAHHLRATAKAAEVIGSDVGYQSPTAFNTAFRRLMGASPGRYRQRLREMASGR